MASRATAFIALLLSSLLAAAAAADERVEVRLSKVVDGDTLVVLIDDTKERVRIIGIDSPEEWPSEKMDRDIARTHIDQATMASLGRRAAEHMGELLRGKKLALIFPKTRDHRDRYGRLLAYVEADGQDAGAQMIRDGFALPYRKFPHARLEAYAQLFHQAVADKAGLWADQDGARLDDQTPAKKHKHKQHHHQPQVQENH